MTNTEKAALERRIDELCAEVEAEKQRNAKLRKLVRYMWDFSCVVPDEPYTSKEELDYSVEVWKRMRELGIKMELLKEENTTLGVGTCHEVEDKDTGFIVCSECGAVHDESYTAYYCWCCGRKVVSP